MKTTFWRPTTPFIKCVFIASVVLFSFQCASTSKSKTPALSNLTPEDLQARVTRNFEQLKSFEGKARVIIELPGSGSQGFSEIFITFPDSVYLKTEAILGIDIGALFLDQRYFVAYAPRENVLYYGETAQLNLREFLQIELNTEELFEALTGLIQVPVHSESTLSYADGKYVLSAPIDNGEIKYWIDPQKFLVTKSQIIEDGKVVMSKEMQRFRQTQGLELPQIIRVTRPQARERITVYYTSQTINRAILPERFKLRYAQNARRVYWGDLEHPRVERELIK